MIVIDNSHFAFSQYGCLRRDANRVWNVGNFSYLTYRHHPTPPDLGFYSAYDMEQAYRVLTNFTGSIPCLEQMRNVNATDEELFVSSLQVLFDFTFDDENGNGTYEDEEDNINIDKNTPEMIGYDVLAYTTYGVNGGTGHPPEHYLLGNNDPLFNYKPGACFTAHESYSACTMFYQDSSGPHQGLIADFLATGGTAAIGHAFEPEAEGIYDSEYWMTNLVLDENHDNIADLTMVEALWSGIPFLSWTAVVVGDPLMRLAFNDQTNYTTTRCPGDLNFDRYVDISDFVLFANTFSSAYPDESYDVLADLHLDGFIDLIDFCVFSQYYGSSW
jgi:hypothetical protein